MKKPYYNQDEREILKLNCLLSDLMKVNIAWVKLIKSITKKDLIKMLIIFTIIATIMQILIYKYKT